MSRYRDGWVYAAAGTEQQPDLFCKNPDVVERLKDAPIQAPKKVPYKYHEDTILKEISDYIDSTYSGHYVGEDNVQSLDLILATGHATGFNVGNILKYGSRFGKKRGFNRDDLLKVIHYAIFELYNQSTRPKTE